MGKKKNKFFADWPASKSPRQGRAQTGDKTSAQKLKASKKTPLLSLPKESEALPDIDKTKVAPSTRERQTSSKKKLADDVIKEAKKNRFTIPHEDTFIMLDTGAICSTFTQNDIYQLENDPAHQHDDSLELIRLVSMFKEFRPTFGVQTMVDKFKKPKSTNKSSEEGNPITLNQNLCQQAILTVCKPANLKRELEEKVKAERSRAEKKFLPNLSRIEQATKAHPQKKVETTLPAVMVKLIDSMDRANAQEPSQSGLSFQNVRDSVSETFGRDSIVMGLIDSALIKQLVDEGKLY